MSYYMGDFYRGDPGLWSWVMSKVVKPAVGMIPGVGPALSSVMPGGVKTAAAGAVKAAKSAIIKHPVLSAAGAAGAMVAAGAEGERMMAGGVVPGHRGMHPCKGMRPGHKPHPCKTGAMVPNRRMNPFNPRAARRAARRLHSLVRHYRKYIGFVSAHRPKGRPYIKRRKK